MFEHECLNMILADSKESKHPHFTTRQNQEK